MRQGQLFRNNGFSRLPNRLPSDLVKDLKAAIMTALNGEVEPFGRNEDGRAARRFSEKPPRIRARPLESLLGSNIEILTNRHNTHPA